MNVQFTPHNIALMVLAGVIVLLLIFITGIQRRQRELQLGLAKSDNHGVLWQQQYQHVQQQYHELQQQYQQLAVDHARLGSTLQQKQHHFDEQCCQHCLL